MTVALALLGLEAARPAAAWALGLPIAYLLLRGAWGERRTLVTGAFELWRDLPAASRATGRRALARPPRSALFVAAALFAGALAWLGPRAALAEEPRLWTCVVDRSPSMALPLAEETRQSAALSAAAAWLETHARRGDRVRWTSPGREARETDASGRPPADWLAPASTAAEPDWSARDAAGVLWITDRAPEPPPEHAGLFASGGGAVPGPVAADGRERIVWDGRALAREPSTEPAPTVVLAGRIPPVLARMVRAWADARGLELVEEGRAGAVLVVAAADGAAPELSRELSVVFGRDGWRASGRARPDGLPVDPAARSTDGSDWLVATAESGPIVLVRARTGRVDCALRELSEPGGDPALFALSWARLLDRCALPIGDVLSLAERRDAGSRLDVAGAPPPERATAAGAGPYVDAALTLAAALLAVLGLADERRGAATASRDATPRGASRRSA